jgi:hypothetical protein
MDYKLSLSMKENCRERAHEFSLEAFEKKVKEKFL